MQAIAKKINCSHSTVLNAIKYLKVTVTTTECQRSATHKKGVGCSIKCAEFGFGKLFVC